jgi:hypothetical protein
MFLEEKLAESSVRIPFHDHRSIRQVGQKILRNIGVILQQVALGNAVVRPKDLLEISERYKCSAHLHFRGRQADRNLDARGALRPGGCGDPSAG